MNFSLLHSAVSSSFRCLMRWRHASAHNRSTQPACTHQLSPLVASKRAALGLLTRDHEGQNTSVSKPLRVVRVLEAGQAHCAVGRMLISGRMADVCAELDRLAAREAAHS